MLNLKKSEGIVINQNDKVFEDSDFANYEFTITILPLTKSQWKQYRRECMTKTGMDETMFSSKIFLNNVVNWTGLKDENGTEIIYSESNKKLIDEMAPFFTSRVAAAALNDISVKEVEKVEKRKN